jgi:hypothetical protein
VAFVTHYRNSAVSALVSPKTGCVTHKESAADSNEDSHTDIWTVSFDSAVGSICAHDRASVETSPMLVNLIEACDRLKHRAAFAWPLLPPFDLIFLESISTTADTTNTIEHDLPVG